MAAKKKTAPKKTTKAVAKPTAAKPVKKYPVIQQDWDESERGWGIRPDGASLHLNEADRAAYVKEYWAEEEKSNPSGDVPDIYSRTGSIGVLEVTLKTYNMIKRSENGIRVYSVSDL